MNMNEEYESFFNQCIERFDDLPQCRMDNNYCQIRTAKGWVVHYEWRLSPQQNIQVGLHFESANSDLNKRRYGKCSTRIDTLRKRIGANNGDVTHGQRGATWFGITVSSQRDFHDRTSVDWAVNMMRVFREVFAPTVAELE